MKEYLAQIVGEAKNPLHGRHLVREYLQARILNSLQRSGAMVPLAFHGGTSLRFLYQIPRYSEDLDFALERTSDLYDFRAYLKAIRAALMAENYLVELRISEQRAVHSAFVRFQGLLHELELSPHPSEVLSIKLEVDTNPPPGATLETTVVRRHEILHLQHHDRASLLAGKLHAILQRPYAKGRDLYDLLWYLSSPTWPAPNLTLLNNALQQTGWAGDPVTGENWRETVKQRLSVLDWETAVAEVRPFMMDPADVGTLTRENVYRLLTPPV
jgi:predicted nucleotidyltransferase component of viral defense system